MMTGAFIGARRSISVKHSIKFDSFLINASIIFVISLKFVERIFSLKM